MHGKRSTNFRSICVKKRWLAVVGVLHWITFLFRSKFFCKFNKQRLIDKQFTVRGYAKHTMLSGMIPRVYYIMLYQFLYYSIRISMILYHSMSINTVK